MHRTIGLKRDDLSLDFGNKFVLSALDLGTHPIEYQTIDKSIGQEYLSSKIGARPIRIEGFILCKRTKNPDGSINYPIEEMEEAQALLSNICSMTEPFTLVNNRSYITCHMTSSIEWAYDYENHNDQISKFTINCESSWSDYYAPVFYDPDLDGWYYNSYTDFGAVIETKLFAKPIYHTFHDVISNKDYSGAIGIEVYPFNSEHRDFKISMKNMLDPVFDYPKYPYDWQGKDLYPYPDQEIEFVRFSGIYPNPGVGDSPFRVVESVTGTFSPVLTKTHAHYANGSYTPEKFTLWDTTSTSMTNPRIYMDSPPEGQTYKYGFILHPYIQCFDPGQERPSVLEDLIPAIVYRAEDFVIDFTV